MFPTSCIYHYPLFLGAQILLVNGCRMSYIYDIFIHNHDNYTMHGDKIKPSAFFLHACSSLDLEPPRHWSCGWGWCDLLRLWNLPWQCCCWRVANNTVTVIMSISPSLLSLLPSLLSLLSSLLLWLPSMLEDCLINSNGECLMRFVSSTVNIGAQFLI